MGAEDHYIRSHNTCYYTLIVDETKDICKQKQLSLVWRYMYEGFVHERFISYTHCEQLHASVLIFHVLDVFPINIKNCISQCYNSTSVMSGAYSGVSARILEENTRAIYIHCHARQQNLALVIPAKTFKLLLTSSP